MTQCMFKVTVVDIIDMDGNPIMKKFQCTNEEDHEGDHLILVQDQYGEY